MSKLTIDDCKTVIESFLNDYPLIDKLHFKVRNTDVDLYGRPVPLKAGYLPYTRPTDEGFLGRIDIVAERHTDVEDLYKSLNHEILGHYGLNTFSPKEKKLLLDSIIRSKDNLKSYWDEIINRYSDCCLYEQAEEVFTLAMESMHPDYHQNMQQTQKNGEETFRSVCYFNNPLTEQKLLAITDMVAGGISNGSRQQLTWLYDDITQQAQIAHEQQKLQAMHPDDPEPEMVM